MKTHKCFKRLSLTSGLVLVLLNTKCAEGKDDWHGTCPKLLYSYHSLEPVSAEGRVGMAVLGEAEQRGQGPGGLECFGRQEEEAALGSD